MDYTSAGFNNFLTRSLDDIALASPGTLETSAGAVAGTSQEVNFDHAPTTGALGSSVAVGNIAIDGVAGRISIFDDQGNEVVRIGNLDD